MILKRLVAGVCAGVLLCTQALADSAPTPPISPDYRPAGDSDEAGFWMMADKAEDSFKTSPLLVRDEALNAYVKGILCKLAKDQCAGMRVYILDQPYFNAAMYPNGAMQVWTGLLLRAQNEAQLSCVLGHEVTHYLKRHTIENWRRAVNTSGAMAVFAIVTVGAGVGLIGLVAQLGAAGALLSFSRDQERDADAGGQDMAAAAGYDPAQCAALWNEQLSEENAEPDQKSSFLYLKTHPGSEERLATMKKRVAEMPAPASPPDVGAETLSAATRSFRAQWLGEELNRAHYDQSLVLVQSLLGGEPNSGELHYYLGETYRRRNAAGDAPKAQDEYKAAIATGNAPNSAYRGLGISEMTAGDAAGAHDAFQHYLDLTPAADDRAMVEYYLAHLGEHS